MGRDASLALGGSCIQKPTSLTTGGGPAPEIQCWGQRRLPAWAQARPGPTTWFLVASSPQMPFPFSASPASAPSPKARVRKFPPGSPSLVTLRPHRLCTTSSRQPSLCSHKVTSYLPSWSQHLISASPDLFQVERQELLGRGLAQAWTLPWPMWLRLGYLPVLPARGMRLWSGCSRGTGPRTGPR